MRPNLSEFSYGFAVVNEWLASLGPLKAAPVFPSLVEEGKAGGGYDVKLTMPGLALFLQFKRSDRLKEPNAREYANGSGIGLPYYRAKITGTRESQQHGLLVALDVHPNIVFYAAPLFHTIQELDDAFLAQQVRQRSFFVRPSQIGLFPDDAAHYACFDGTNLKVCSEPMDVPVYSAEQVDELLQKLLAGESRPFGDEPLDEALNEARAAEGRYVEQEKKRIQDQIADVREEMVRMTTVDMSATGAELQPMEFGAARPSRELRQPDDPRLRKLQELADIGLRQFNAQLFVIQQL